MPGRSLFDVYDAETNGRLTRTLLKAKRDGTSQRTLAAELKAHLEIDVHHTTAARWMERVA